MAESNTNERAGKWDSKLRTSKGGENKTEKKSWGLERNDIKLGGGANTARPYHRSLQSFESGGNNGRHRVRINLFEGVTEEQET